MIGVLPVRGTRALGFRILGEIREVETFAVGRGIRELRRLQRAYGKGGWRKRKGIARILYDSGRTAIAELHWYEAHGIGRRELKVKRHLEWDV